VTKFYNLKPCLKQFEAEGAQNAGAKRRPKHFNVPLHFCGDPPRERALQKVRWARPREFKSL